MEIKKKPLEKKKISGSQKEKEASMWKRWTRSALLNAGNAKLSKMNENVSWI